MTTYPEVWPNRQKICYLLDILYDKIKKPVKKASKNKWGAQWQEEATKFAEQRYGYRRNKETDLDLHLCLLLAKAYWNWPQIDRIIEVRHRWAHQRSFNKIECDGAIKVIEEFIELLSSQKGDQCISSGQDSTTQTQNQASPA